MTLKQAPQDEVCGAFLGVKTKIRRENLKGGSEMTDGYFVRFYRNDSEIEEYFYWHFEDAKYHADLFDESDSDLFQRIEISQLELNEFNEIEEKTIWAEEISG